MKIGRAIFLVLAVIMAVGSTVAMLPPDVFKDPIFASQDSSDDGGSSHEPSDFA